jgi:hypothetical protein
MLEFFFITDLDLIIIFYEKERKSKIISKPLSETTSHML